MRGIYRLAVYLLFTAVIEGSSIAVLYAYGFPDHTYGPGVGALLIAFNIIFYFFWGNAISGPETAAPPGSLIYNPNVQLVGGFVGMFMIVTVIGEGINWLSGRIIEMTGMEEESSRFNRKLESAVHDFVDATYSSKQAKKAAETRISELYSKNPNRVLEYLSEILDRTKKIGTAKTAKRVEQLIVELQGRTEENAPA